MSIIKRISATITSRVDDVVAHIENHDAVIEAALKDTRTALAKAKVRHTRILKDGQNIRNKLEELQKNENLWADRAKNIASTDKKKALECVHRRNLCHEQIIKITENITNHKNLEAKIGASVNRMEQRLDELTQQRNMMRSRHSAADAMRVINKIENNSTSGIEDTFDRWEMLITETEYDNGQCLNGGYTEGEFSGSFSQELDTLDASFSKAENQDRLEAELDALLSEHDEDSDKNSKMED